MKTSGTDRGAVAFAAETASLQSNGHLPAERSDVA